MSMILANSRIKGAEVTLLPDGVEVKYSLCIKNILAEVILDRGQFVYQDYNRVSAGCKLIHDISKGCISLVPSKNNWYLTKRKFLAFGYCESTDILTVSERLREELEDCRKALELRYASRIKEKLYNQFINHKK